MVTVKAGFAPPYIKVFKQAIKKKGKMFRFSGSSMLPSIFPGEMIKIQATNHIKRGDIVCFFLNEKLVAHRVIFCFNKYVLTKGDNNIHLDGYVKKEEIVGYINVSHDNSKMKSIISLLFAVFFALLFNSITYRMTRLKNILLPNTELFLSFRDIQLNLLNKISTSKRVSK